MALRDIRCTVNRLTRGDVLGAAMISRGKVRRRSVNGLTRGDLSRDEWLERSGGGKGVDWDADADANANVDADADAGANADAGADAGADADPNASGKADFRDSSRDPELEWLLVALLEETLRVAKVVLAHCDAVMKDYTELSLAELLVLRALGDSPGPMSSKELARERRCSKANMSVLVRRLLGLELVRRERRRHARRTRAPYPLYLTDRGFASYERAKPMLVELAQMLFAGLDRGEVKSLVGLLSRITSPE